MRAGFRVLMFGFFLCMCASVCPILFNSGVFFVSVGVSSFFFVFVLPSFFRCVSVSSSVSCSCVLVLCPSLLRFSQISLTLSSQSDRSLEISWFLAACLRFVSCGRLRARLFKT